MTHGARTGQWTPGLAIPCVPRDSRDDYQQMRIIRGASSVILSAYC